MNLSYLYILKTITFLIALVFSFGSYAQKANFFEATYDVFYNTSVPNTKKSLLQIDFENHLSTFFIYKGTLNAGIKKNEDNTISITEKGADRYIKINYNDDSLISKEQINGRPYYLKEKIPSLHWTIKDSEIKNIGNLKCKQATLKFRGRDYIAWFTEEIPISEGPYKFNGLPGLIVLIHDITNRYTWSLTSYKSLNSNEAFIKLEKPKKFININDYVDLRYGKKKKLNSARLPRGIGVEYLKIARNGIEIEFDWEN